MTKDEYELPIKFLEEFEQKNQLDWEALVDSSLKGKPTEGLYERETSEGFTLKPIYARNQTTLSNSPSVQTDTISKIRKQLHKNRKQASWNIGQNYYVGDVQTVNKDLLEDLNGGVNSISLVVRPLDDCPDSEGVEITSLSDVNLLFDGVDLRGKELHLSASHFSLPVAAIFASYFEQKKNELGAVRGSFGANPIGDLAKTGEPFRSLMRELEHSAMLASWMSANMPTMRSLLVDTSIFYEGGISETQDLAFSISIALEYMRAMTQNGLSLEKALKQISFKIPIGTNVFHTIAKLRALRIMWARIVENCGAPANLNPALLDASISKRVLSGRDVSVNMLRASCACFSAVAGGADTVTLFPHTQIVSAPSSSDRRIIRNIQNVLKHESFIANVADPAGGSFYVENLTDIFAQKSWEIFQLIESKGGFSKQLLAGSIYEMVEKAWKVRKNNLDTRRDSVTGVSSFPDLYENLEKIEAVVEKKLKAQSKTGLGSNDLALDGSFDDLFKAAGQGAHLSVLAKFLGERAKAIKPIQARRLSEDFERLRDNSDVWLKKKKRRPTGLIIRLGKPVDYNARVVFAQNYMAVGGIETQEIDMSNGDVEKAINGQGIDFIIICSSDRVYEEILEVSVKSLRSMTQKMIVLASKPSKQLEPLKALGLDKFIYSGDKILDTLQDIAEEIGFNGT